MKTIVAVWNTAGKGKSETLKELAILLLKTYPSYKEVYKSKQNISSKGDFSLVIEVNGVVIGVESQGDPNTNLKNRLINLSDKYACDIIFCSSRTRGETVKAIDFLVDSRGFQHVWTSTYQISNLTNYGAMNKLKAKHLLELIQSLGLI